MLVGGLKKDMQESFVSGKRKGKARAKKYVEVDDEEDKDNKDDKDEGEDGEEDDGDDNEEDDKTDCKVVEDATTPLAPPMELPFATKRQLGALGPAPSKMKHQNTKLHCAKTPTKESFNEEDQLSHSLSLTTHPKAAEQRQEQSNFHLTGRVHLGYR